MSFTVFVTTVQPPCCAPIPTSPSGSIGLTTPSYVWSAVLSDVASGPTASDAATWYYLWVDGPGGNVIKQWYTAASVCSGASCAVTPASPLAAGAHTWWVRAWNPNGFGPWSAGTGFTVPATGAAPAQSTLTAPMGSITDTTPDYSWQRVDGSTSYYLWVDGPGGNVIKQWFTAASACVGNTCSVTPTTVLVSGAHRMWIRSWNPAGSGPWSARGDFTVQ